MPPERACCYIDLDGTLLGSGGSVLRTGAGVSDDPSVRALLALTAAGAVSYTHLTLPTNREV